jgi:hypothetical protein
MCCVKAKSTGEDEQADEHDRDPAQPPALGRARRIAREQQDDERGLDQRRQPRHVEDTVAREPDPHGDVDHHEPEHDERRRPA